MALKIRLRRQGRTNRPFYRFVVTEVTTRRDGKYMEALGWYDPLVTEVENGITIDVERVQHWLDRGAQLSEGAVSLIARRSPQFIADYKQKLQAHRAKVCAKRKASKAKA
jgi:small subunit ribosomal protein S16